ncbi:MAG: preprotein translocase subunit SecA [Candidatus Omnitrophica bacterium ADurb.Bin277]|nr:MAG: preprotein translocase subunit SecA [Candidatus Omnitrophica bacterium ADurb.Bin277]
MIGFILKKIFGTQNARTLKTLWPVVAEVNAFEAVIQKLSDAELRAKTDEFRKRLAGGAALDSILPEAFAVVREASKRTTKMRHFDVQILGGLVLHKGKIAEMSTGEGKTLVATLPLYLNALEGKGAHLVTVNDYLAKRDRHWMGPIFEFLGLTVGVIQHDMPHEDRQKAYAADITYGTNNEFGFDYLRDNMVASLDGRVQRPLHYAIVDEVDSILIDEARTPLIISGPAEESTDKYYRAQRASRGLKGYRIVKEEVDPEWKAKLEEIKKEHDYIADEKAKTIRLTESGEAKAAKAMGVENMHDSDTVTERHHVITALRAKEFFERDVDYIVKDNEILIVDEFTGRLMPGRRFSDGLHQALEAKESVEIKRENQTLATVTFQNYFRMYKKLGGMTGTAATEAIEFEKIYKLDVVVVPTNRPCVRIDQHDSVYRTEKEKFEAVVREVAEVHKQGRPALVGTVSIEKSERLSKMLQRINLPHTVLNAKYHEKEAEIVAQAGQPGAVTIATNMAGRGTDIVLGAGVKEKGGLAVIGTERHEARRIDNQLRGRCGRQGDPGTSKFFISLEDELMRLFGSDRISGLMQRLGMQEGDEIQHPFVNRAMETAQRRVEAYNFEIRKHLLEYDDVMNRQRELIYGERDLVLKGSYEELKKHVLEMTENVIEGQLLAYVNPDIREEEKDYEGLIGALAEKFGADFRKSVDENLYGIESLQEEIEEKVRELYDSREKAFGIDRFHFLEKYILLQVIDTKWKEHLYSLDSLREGIGLRAYGQRDPLVEYKREAFNLFDAMTDVIKEEAIELLFRVQVVHEEKIRAVPEAPARAQYIHPESGGIKKTAEKVQQATEQGMDMESRFASRQSAPDQKPVPVHRQGPKVGRNDPCPCGSGKKHKKCCGMNE